MVLSDILAVLIGVLFGVLASVPLAVVIAVSTRTKRRSRVVDFGAAWQQPQSTSVTIDVPSRELTLIAPP